MSKSRADDEPAIETLKKDLHCWELDEKTQQRTLHEYKAGDPVPAHLTAQQRENLAAQGVL